MSSRPKKCPYPDQIFDVGMSVYETNRRTSHNPSLVALPEISRLTRSTMSIGDPIRSYTAEMFDYYAAALAWLRIISLKMKNHQSLTEAEEKISCMTATMTFSVPEPLSLYYKSIGNVISMTGQHLYPTFPEMPEQVVGQHGGYFGPIGVDNHALYEEIPALGVFAEAVRWSVSDSPPWPYPSALAPVNQVCNENLLGFRPLQHRGYDAKNTAISLGITAETFPETVPNTGFNIELMLDISAHVGRSNAFKMSSICFSSLSKVGAPAMLVTSRPMPEGSPGIRNVEGEQRVTSLSRETCGTYGMAICFDFHMMKVTAPAPLGTAAWCPVTPTDSIPTPPEWIANVNDRQNLPSPYDQISFSSMSTYASGYRDGVVRKLFTNRRS